MDKFTKVRNIGKGNMGACALARNNEDGKYYVIKQVDLTRMNRKERQQSLNEARVLSALKHPNIINYVDSFLAKKSDHLCIVMEYADGGDLGSRIKKNYGVNFRESQVLDWLIQIVLSLHYVHQRKILHRDIKSQNVFLTSDSVVKLGDFGISRALNGTYDQAKTFVGTPYYLSPELILERPYDYASDVWALGVVLYEIMALKHPFNANDMKGLMQRILKVQYDPLPLMYTTELRNIVPRMLMKDPSQRIALADLLELPVVQRRLKEWLKGDVVPEKYLEALIKNRLLPDSTLRDVMGGVPPTMSSQPVACPHPTTLGATGADGACYPPRSRTESPALPALVPAASGHVNGVVETLPGEQVQDRIAPGARAATEETSTSSSARRRSPQRHYTRQVPGRLGANAAPTGLYGRYGNQVSSSNSSPRLPLASRSPYLQNVSRSSEAVLPSHAGDMDNYYQQLNYYQSAARQSPGHRVSGEYRPYRYPLGGVAPTSSPSTSPARGYLPSIPVGNRARYGVAPRAESQPAYLNPLFRAAPASNSRTPPPLKSGGADVAGASPAVDIKGMLQRAAMERAQRRMGGAV